MLRAKRQEKEGSMEARHLIQEGFPEEVTPVQSLKGRARISPIVVKEGEEVGREIQPTGQTEQG